MFDRIASRILAICCLIFMAGILTSANWPSASGTTAQGVVIEDGAGAKIVPCGS